MAEAVLGTALYFTLGVIIAIAYHLLWNGPFRLRHIVLWPLVEFSMMRCEPPPRWMAPAPRDVAAQERQNGPRPQPTRPNHPPPSERG